MNAKKAKAARAALRAKGINFRDAKYAKTKEHNVYSYDIEGKVNGATTAHTAVLHNCGRQIYKQLKKGNK